MVDLHSHLLDDENNTTKDIVKSLVYAHKRGYKKVVFTPKVVHLKKNDDKYNELLNRFKEVESLLEEKDLDLDVSLGAEIIAYKGIVDDLIANRGKYGISNYVVLDISQYHSSIDELAYMLQLNDFVPIFSGVEKTGYKHLHKHAQKWHQSGAKILVSAKHMFGNTLEATRVKSLVRHSQIDFVSSGKVNRMNPFTVLRLAKYYVTTIIGPNYAKNIFSLNAKTLFNTEDEALLE